jgi:7-cyano-7-deazaguanine reductase
MNEKNIYQDLKQLGANAFIATSPDEALIETVENPNKSLNYMVRFTAPEFTSLCPMTGQPDFAHLVIDYIPNQKLVESKSLKLFLTSFRNHGAFHEACTVDIAKRLIKELDPKWIRIGGYWYPRGGMPIDIFFAQGEIPEGVWIPDQKVDGYRGRG